MIGLRLIVLLASVVVVAFALSRGAEVRSCDDARGAAFTAAVTPQAQPLPDSGRALARDVIDHCRGSEPLALSAQALVRLGAVEGAQRLADTALDRDPDAFQAHNALAAVLDARGRPQEAEGERARARALNPLAPAPRAPRLGPDGRPLSG